MSARTPLGVVLLLLACKGAPTERRPPPSEDKAREAARAAALQAAREQDKKEDDAYFASCPHTLMFNPGTGEIITVCKGTEGSFPNLRVARQAEIDAYAKAMGVKR